MVHTWDIYFWLRSEFGSERQAYQTFNGFSRGVDWHLAAVSLTLFLPDLVT